MDDLRDSQGMLNLDCRFCKQPFKAPSKRHIYCDACKHAGKQALYRDRKSLETFLQNASENNALFIEYALDLQKKVRAIADEDIEAIIKGFKESELDKNLDESDRAEEHLNILYHLDNLGISFYNFENLYTDRLRLIYTNHIALKQEQLLDLFDKVSKASKSIQPEIVFQSDLEDFGDDDDDDGGETIEIES